MCPHRILRLVSNLVVNAFWPKRINQLLSILFDSSSSASVVEVIEYLLSRFNHLKVSRSNVCNFMKSEFNLSLKKADSHPVESNSSAKVK